MTADTDVRSELIQIIGYQGETCLPDEKPVMAFFTDRYLNPVLDGLVRYIEEIRADERAVAIMETRIKMRAEYRMAVTDLRAQVEALPVDYTRRPPTVYRYVCLDDVLALLGGESA